MKLSAFLAVSVPIMAASQLPAVAADPSNSGAWLQESLNELSPQKAKMASASYSTSLNQMRRAASVPVHVAHAAPIASATKLRPFKPGRYLPSEKDLRAAAMQAQQARYDYSADNAQLSGQVSSQYAAPRTASAYDQYAMPSGYAASMPPALMPIAQRVKTQIKKAIGQRAPRVVPNQMPMLPEQLTQGPMVQSPVKPMIPEPQVQRQVRAPFPVSMPVGQYVQPSVQQMPQPMAMQPQFQSENINPQEVATMFQQVAMNPPQARMNFNGEIVGQANDNPGSGGGQPPFPLNMFGGNALQQLSQSQHRSMPSVPPARFGSWHGNNGLPDAGFHSYVMRRRSAPIEYAPIQTVATKRSAPKASRKSSYAPPPTVSRAPSPKPVVATYPAYTSYRSTY